MDKKSLLALSIIIILFALAVFITRRFDTLMADSLDIGFWGIIIYFVATLLATVIAPLSTVPLIPIATALWGPLLTSFLNVISWGVGSIIAFKIARRFGKPYVGKFVDLDNLSKYERALSEEYLFWNIVFLRMMIPVDIFSYAVGLFSSIKLKPYILATFIGITPFAFILSYAPQAPIQFQIFAGIMVITFLYLGYRQIRSKMS